MISKFVFIQTFFFRIQEIRETICVIRFTNWKMWLFKSFLAVEGCVNTAPANKSGSLVVGGRKVKNNLIIGYF